MANTTERSDARRRRRVRYGLACVAVAIAAAFPAAALAGASVSGDSGPLYVALGDSVAAGAGGSPGYVERLFTHYQSTLGVTRLSNAAVGGETSATIRTRGQLDSALAEINAPSDTRAVTIDIGGNDRYECADRWDSCAFRNNFSATLADLKAALDSDPGDESFAAMPYYNPASGLGGDAPHSGEAWYDRQLLGTDLKIDEGIETGPEVGINDVIYQEAARHGARVADPYPAFKRCGQAFISDGLHPSDAGHAAIADAFRGASTPCPPEEEPPPPNDFGLGKVKKNKRRGTARLTVIVPGPGELELAKTRKVKRKLKRAAAAGKVKLVVEAKGSAKRKLRRKGRVKVRAWVRFTPTGGNPNSQPRQLKLVKR